MRCEWQVQPKRVRPVLRAEVTSHEEDGRPRVAQIDEALYQLSRQYGRVFLFIDPFGYNPLEDLLVACDRPQPPCVRLGDKMFLEDLERAPFLVEVSHAIPAHYGVLQRSIEYAHAQSARTNGIYPVCAWVFSSTSMERMRSELTRRLDARYPRHHVYFRYFDPRVMPHLASILRPTNDASNSSNSSFSDLLGPVDVWCHLDGGGRLVRHDNPSPGQKKHIGAMHFDEQTSAAIDRIEAINRTTDELEGRDWLTGIRADASVDQHLQDALGRGLRDLDDCVAYAWRAAGYGKAFLEHPELQDFIGEALNCGMPFEYLLQERLPTIV